MKKVTTIKDLKTVKVGDSILQFEHGVFKTFIFEGCNGMELFTSNPNIKSVIIITPLESVLKAPFSHGYFINPELKKALEIQIEYHEKTLEKLKTEFEKCKK